MDIANKVIVLVNERLDILPLLEACVDMTHTAEYQETLDNIDTELNALLNP